MAKEKARRERESNMKMQRRVIIGITEVGFTVRSPVTCLYTNGNEKKYNEK